MHAIANRRKFWRLLSDRSVVVVGVGRREFALPAYVRAIAVQAHKNLSRGKPQRHPDLRRALTLGKHRIRLPIFGVVVGTFNDHWRTPKHAKAAASCRSRDEDAACIHRRPIIQSATHW